MAQDVVTKTEIDVKKTIFDMLLDISIEKNWSAYQYYTLRNFVHMMLSASKSELERMADHWEKEMGEEFPFRSFIESKGDRS